MTPALAPLRAAHAPSPVDRSSIRKPNRVSDGDMTSTAPLRAAHTPSPDVRSSIRKPNRVSDGDMTSTALLWAAHAPSPDVRSSIRKPNRVSDGDMTSTAPLWAAHAPSPDVRCAHPGLRSLDAALASPSWLRSTSNAGSRGMGSPSLGSNRYVLADAGRAAGRSHAQEPVRFVPRGAHSVPFGRRTHTPQVGRRPQSRRRRACLRPAAWRFGSAPHSLGAAS